MLVFQMRGRLGLEWEGSIGGRDTISGEARRPSFDAQLTYRPLENTPGLYVGLNAGMPSAPIVREREGRRIALDPTFRVGFTVGFRPWR